MRLLIALLLLAALGVSTPAATVPIKNGLLQSDMNAGGYKLTNVTAVLDPSGNPLTGGGGSFTNQLILSNSQAILTVNTNIGGTNGVALDVNTSVIATVSALNSATNTEAAARIAGDEATLIAATNSALAAATNQTDLFVSSSITLGNPLTGTRLTSTSSSVYDGQQPFIKWNDWIEYTTNSVVVVSNPVSAYNQIYAFNSTFGSYTGLTATLRGLSGTNGGWKMSLVSGLGTAAYTNLTSILTNAPPSWRDVTAGTNIFMQVILNTQACWRVQTYGPITNWLDYSNGIGGIVISNGSIYDVSSRVGSTNKSWQLRLAAP